MKLLRPTHPWTATNMARTHGRCAKGERLRMGFPHGHRKTTTLVAGPWIPGNTAESIFRPMAA